MSNTEILQIIEAVSNGENIPRDNLISAIEQAMQSAGRKKYGDENNIKAEINKKNGEIKLYRVLDIVDEIDPEISAMQILIDEAMAKNPEVRTGDQIYELLPPVAGRVAAQIVKHVIVQKVGDAKREKQYHDFKDRRGEILSGIVKRVEFGNIIVDLNRAEAIIKKDQTIKGEDFKINDRVKAYVQDVRLEAKGPQIFLSRADEMMLAKLFELEVPEIYDGIIEVKAIARDPGSKAKIAVYAADSSIDPVGSCVGIRGNRVRSITTELNGEKIDVILWSNNVAQFVMNAMSTPDISKIVIDEDKGRVEIVVPSEHLSIAIGRRGQNVRLASKLTGWRIDVMTDEQESKRRNEEFNSSTELFMNGLDVEKIIAQLLSVEGFTSIEQIAAADPNNLASIEGFEAELAEEIIKRAVDYVNNENGRIIEKLEELGVEQDLIDILDLAPEYILALAEYGIKSIEDLGEMSLGEFRSLVPNSNLSDEYIKMMIATARRQE